MSVISFFRKYPRTFWIGNTVELFERWSWYGVFSLFSLYLVGSTDEGALGLSHTEKGLILGIGTAILYFLPVITGSIADRIGYKKVLLISFVIYFAGFVSMPLYKGFWGVFMVYLILAMGGALFKPIILATVSKTTDDTTSSVGFGIFYQMVNIGAFIGPLFSSKLRQSNWDSIFFLSAGIVCVNFLLVWLFYKEPGREKTSIPLKEIIISIFRNIGEALSDVKFVIFLILISGFWTMYFQLFFTLPVFIDQWIDTTKAYDFFNSFWPWLATNLGNSDGTISAELIVNFDAFFIIFFQIIVSALVMRLRPMQAMMSGIMVAAIGMGLTFVTQNGLFTIVALFVFAIGEMASSPKTNEYVGKIAPPEKVALYMGCNFLPIAAGNFFAGIISGAVYEKIADKITFLQMEAAERGYSIEDISENFTQNQYINKFSELSGLSSIEITNMLWDKYNPSSFWIIVTCIGVIAALGLFVYDKAYFKNKEAISS